MDIEYKGGNCVIITAKKTTFCIDPKISDLGLKDQVVKATAQLATQHRFKVEDDDVSIIIDGPGEYEVENISVKGVAAQAHTDAKDAPKMATIYRIDTSDVSVAVVGHIHPDLSEAQLEAIGVVDVLVVPVGGNGYTLDATGAVKIVKMIDPKIIIPTNYADKGIDYPVPQAGLDLFVKELGAPVETMSKAKFKAGSLPEALTVYEVTRTA